MFVCGEVGCYYIPYALVMHIGLGCIGNGVLKEGFYSVLRVRGCASWRSASHGTLNVRLAGPRHKMMENSPRGLECSVGERELTCYWCITDCYFYVHDGVECSPIDLRAGNSRNWRLVRKSEFAAFFFVQIGRWYNFRPGGSSRNEVLWRGLVRFWF